VPREQLMKLFGVLKDNYVAIGAVASKNFTVPAGKRWEVFGGSSKRDVSATLDIEVYNENDKLIMRIPQIAAGVTTVSWGAMLQNVSAGSTPFPFPMKAGWYVKYTYGAAQTNPEVTLLVSEHDV